MGHVDVVHTRRLDGSAVEEELLVRYRLMATCTSFHPRCIRFYDTLLKLQLV